MNNSRAPLIAVGVILLLPVVYLGCYLGRGTMVPIHQTPAGKFVPAPSPGSQFVHVSRFYNTHIEVLLFSPAGRVESLIRGIEVQVRDYPEARDVLPTR